MKNTVTLLFARMFEKGIMFLFFMLLAQAFGKEAFGEFSYFFAIASILFVLFNVGGEFYQIREFSRVENLKNFHNIFIIKTFLFLVVFIFVYLYVGDLFLLLLLLSFYIEGILSIYKSSLHKNGKYILESKFSILEKSVFILISFLNIFTIENLLIMYVAFLISKLVYLLLITQQFYTFKYILKTKKLFDFNFSKNYLFNSWSYMLHGLLVIIFVQIDTVMLKHMGVSYAEIGLYAAASKIYVVSFILADVLFKQYYPLTAKYIHEKEEYKLRSIILKVQNGNLYFGIYLSLLMMIFSVEIVDFAFGKEFKDSANMLVLLSTIVLFRFSMFTYTAILSSSNLNKIKLYTSIVCVLINIGLNYILIPIYGVNGAIVATIITEIALVVLYKISSTKIVFVNSITLYEVFAILLVFLSCMLTYTVHIELFIKVLLALVIVLTMAVNYKNIIEKLTYRRV